MLPVLTRRQRARSKSLKRLNDVFEFARLSQVHLRTVVDTQTHVRLAVGSCNIILTLFFNFASQASATERGCMKSQNTQSAAERHSRIVCECHQSTGRRRCSASPELEGQEEKENEQRTGQELDGYRVNSVRDKQEPEHMDYEETDKSIFLDDDSNQILPVEQFFGNLDIVQVRHFEFCLN